MKELLHDFKNYLNNKMKAIKLKNKKIITNYYNNLSCNDEVVCYDEKDNSIIFTLKGDKLDRLFFYSSNELELIDLLKACNSECIIDYITNTDYKSVDEIMERSGFYRYAIYKRVVNTKLEYSILDNMPSFLVGKDIESSGKYANENDIFEIHEIMYKYFDEVCDHIIPISELRRLAKNRNIVIEREGRKLVTFNVNEQFGRRLHMRYSYNSGSKDNMHSIYLNVFKKAIDNGATYTYSWINEKNLRSLNFHKRYNINFDGMLNLIYTKKGVNDERNLKNFG